MCSSDLIRFVEMNSVDVQRSEVVSRVLNLYYPVVRNTSSISAAVNSSAGSEQVSQRYGRDRNGFDDAAIIPSYLYKS